MKKKILFLALLSLSMCLNAQTVLSTNKQVKKLYVESINADKCKVHSVDTCAFIKQFFFDDQTKMLDRDLSMTPMLNFVSPYEGIGSTCYFCDRCMTEALIAEFKKRYNAYLKTKGY